jgi:hypothetical protein
MAAGRSGAIRVLVTGSRTWDDPDVIAVALSRIERQYGPFVLVHGGAAGADTIAAMIHHQNGGQNEAHLALWSTYGKRAGYIRNAEMVKAGADLCIAFIKDGSRGATMCAKLAEEAGIPTKRFLSTTGDAQ